MFFVSNSTAGKSCTEQASQSLCRGFVENVPGTSGTTLNHSQSVTEDTGNIPSTLQTFVCSQNLVNRGQYGLGVSRIAVLRAPLLKIPVFFSWYMRTYPANIQKILTFPVVLGCVAPSETGIPFLFSETEDVSVQGSAVAAPPCLPW